MNGDIFKLRHFLTTLPQPIERLRNSQMKPKHCIFQIYKILTVMAEPKIPPYMEKWEKELGTQLNEQQLGKVLRMVHSSAVDINTIEINYKCLERWYITPVKAQKYQPEKSYLCWRGCNLKGTMAHLLWECPKIREYRRKALQQIWEITGIDIPDGPWFCLFHSSKSTIKRYKSTVIPHLMNNVKGSIPNRWQELESPTKKDWVKRVEYIFIQN